MRQRHRGSCWILAVIAALVVGLVVIPAVEGTAVSERGSLFGVSTSQKVVGLTFDDGPDPRWTPTAVDLLQKDGVHATFFFIGSRVGSHRDLVDRVLQGGNEIGNHTWDHPHLRHLGPVAVEDQLVRTDAAIREVGAPAPRYFRPPYGEGDRTVAVIASSHGYRTVYWGICIEKYADHEPSAQAVQAILKRIHPGMIVLAHDGGPPDRSRTFAVLPTVLQGLRQKGYRIDDVTELLRDARRFPAPSHAARHSGPSNVARHSASARIARTAGRTHAPRTSARA